MAFISEYKMARRGFVVKCLNCDHEFFIHDHDIIPHHTMDDMMDKHECEWCHNEEMPSDLSTNPAYMTGFGMDKDRVRQELTKLAVRIREIALKTSQDYPNIDGVDMWEQLYAIETAYEGTNMACNDWSEVMKLVMKRYNIEYDTIKEMFEEVRKRQIHTDTEDGMFII